MRILTGDYLNITQAQALRRLVDLENAENLSETCDNGLTPAAASPKRGQLELRVVETATLQDFATTFHPKAWIFIKETTGTAYVGSSNISRAALRDGVEWNLRVEECRDRAAFTQVASAYEALWERGRRVDGDWLTGYVERAAASRAPLPPGEMRIDATPLPEPWDVQSEALDALRVAREQSSRDRAIVVMATGIGKTWLAAFEVDQLRRATGSMPRVLFIAHRVEMQAARTFRRLFADVRFGWYVGATHDLAGDVVFASITKISRLQNLRSIDCRSFGYVIIDEVHHAAAESYRRVMNWLEPSFWLGLTATPERADAGDIVGLFDDHIAYRADIGVGIASNHLVPLRYHGLADEVDYRPIPWRNRRFDPAALEEAVLQGGRMEQVWGALEEHPGKRTLVFCCSIRHAHAVADYLTERGLRTLAVHSGSGSGDRFESLQRLSGGELDALATVDLFNEGVDLPEIDRVVMLRPTESSVVFLQQLGRGLRTAEGKDWLTVIDFIGNHRVFLNRIRNVLALLPESGSTAAPNLAALLADQTVTADDCSVAIQLEAVDLLRMLLPTGDRHVLARAYRELRNSRDERPTIAEMFRLGYNVRSLYAGGWASWFDFLLDEGDLTPTEQGTLNELRDWFAGLERTRMEKCFKMVVLEVMLDQEALFSGMQIDDLARRSYRHILRSPELFQDIVNVKRLGEPRSVSPKAWRAYWLANPLHFWSPSFKIDGDRFVPTFHASPEQHATASRMTRELVEYRLAQYRRRQRERLRAGEESFTCRLIQTHGRPIIKLPDRSGGSRAPDGETNCLLPDGALWRFRFKKEFVNVARPVGVQTNQLADLMRGWFGNDAGQPGTDFRVHFFRVDAEWHAEPAEAEAVESAVTRATASDRGAEVEIPVIQLAFYPTLRVACGAFRHPQSQDDPETIGVPDPRGLLDPTRHFVAVAEGHSMDGGNKPIRDGDLILLERQDATHGGSLSGYGRPWAIEYRDDLGAGDTAYALKLIVKEGDQKYRLKSYNRTYPPVPVDVETTFPFARFIRVLERAAVAGRDA